MATVVLLGTLDTKGREYSYVRDRLIEAGCDVITINTGVLADPDYPTEYSRLDVAEAAGFDLKDLVSSSDRGKAVMAMAEGAAAIVSDLHERGRLQGVLGLGGSGGSSIISKAMRRLPVGVPKLLVSTMAAGNIAPYVGTSDIAVMYSVVDIAGINQMTARIFTNAANAIAGMAMDFETSSELEPGITLVGATMYGSTTPCVNRTTRLLEGRGYEVLVFHATGTGGRSMEDLIRNGRITASLDITTAELMAELCGGTFTAGPDRLEAAAELGIAQVVSVGGIDTIAFTPPEAVPSRYQNRKRHVHNAAVTLVRSNPEECERFGEVLAEKLNRSKGPVTLFLPLKGVSSYGMPGGVFHDPDADEAMFAVLRSRLDASIELVELDTHINDPIFADALASKLAQHVRESEPAD